MSTTPLLSANFHPRFFALAFVHYSVVVVAAAAISQPPLKKIYSNSFSHWRLRARFVSTMEINFVQFFCSNFQFISESALFCMYDDIYFTEKSPLFCLWLTCYSVEESERERAKLLINMASRLDIVRMMEGLKITFQKISYIYKIQKIPIHWKSPCQLFFSLRSKPASPSFASTHYLLCAKLFISLKIVFGKSWAPLSDLQLFFCDDGRASFSLMF